MAAITFDSLDAHMSDLAERVGRNEQTVIALTGLVNLTAQNVAGIVATCKERGKTEGQLADDIARMSVEIAEKVAAKVAEDKKEDEEARKEDRNFTIKLIIVAACIASGGAVGLVKLIGV